MAIDPQKAAERLQRQYKNQNEYIKNNYDRISVTLPKGTKEQIVKTGDTLNGFISRVVQEELQRIDKGTEDK